VRVGRVGGRAQTVYGAAYGCIPVGA